MFGFPISQSLKRRDELLQIHVSEDGEKTGFELELARDYDGFIRKDRGDKQPQFEMCILREKIALSALMKSKRNFDYILISWSEEYIDEIKDKMFKDKHALNQSNLSSISYCLNSPNWKRIDDERLYSRLLTIIKMYEQCSDEKMKAEIEKCLEMCSNCVDKYEELVRKDC